MAHSLNLVSVGLGLLCKSYFKVQIEVRMMSLDIDLRISEALRDPHTSQAAAAEKNPTFPRGSEPR